MHPFRWPGEAARPVAIAALLVLAALLLHPHRALRGGDHGGRDVLLTLAAGVMGAMAAFLVVLVVRNASVLRPGPRRGAHRRVPARTLITQITVVALCAALLMTPAGALLLDRLRGDRSPAATEDTAGRGNAGRTTSTSGARQRAVATAAAAGAALVVLVIAATAAARRTRPTGASAGDDDLLKRAVVAAARELGAQPAHDAAATARERVIRCYAAMETALAAAGTARRAADTPAELLARATARGALPREPAAALTALFERARFGPANLRDDDVAAARSALDQLHAALASSGEDEPARTRA